MKFYYEETSTGYILHMGDKTCDEQKEIVFIVQITKEANLIKFNHGAKEHMETSKMKAKIEYLKSIAAQFNEEVRIITVNRDDGVKIEDINHFINTSALPAKWLDRFKPIIDVEYEVIQGL